MLYQILYIGPQCIVIDMSELVPDDGQRRYQMTKEQMSTIQDECQREERKVYGVLWIRSWGMYPVALYWHGSASGNSTFWLESFGKGIFP